LGAVAFGLRLPNRYESESTLVVVQQQISQRYVEPTNLTTVADAVQAMKREILSRSRLLPIINEFGLYLKEKEHQTPDALIERMRDKDIDIQPVDPAPNGSFTAFKISFTAESPNLAQAVTSRLTSLFIEENLKARGSQAARTTSFLTEQLEAVKQKLASQEQRLKDFKMRNIGELPEQQAANLGTLTDFRMRLAASTANLSRAQQQRISLESLINGNLSRLEADKRALLTRYTAKHAEVLKKDQEIERMQALIERLRTGPPPIEKAQTLSTPDDFSIVQLKGQLDANTAEIESLTKEEQRLTAQIADYQNRLNLTPIKEQQLTEIFRDYDLLKQDYKELLGKQQQSQLTTSLEERQEGQHFRLVDPPTLPVRPASPKRLNISLAGAGAGVALGLVLAFLMDAKDRSLHTEKELKQHFRLPLVLGVPILYTPAEERSRNWKRALEWFAGGTMTTAVLAAEVYIYLYH
jgi:polysaccharide chain length determinant protein (PEP-CTERM system associated)